MQINNHKRSWGFCLGSLMINVDCHWMNFILKKRQHFFLSYVNSIIIHTKSHFCCYLFFNTKTKNKTKTRDRRRRDLDNNNVNSNVLSCLWNQWQKMIFIICYLLVTLWIQHLWGMKCAVELRAHFMQHLSRLLYTPLLTKEFFLASYECKMLQP